MREEFIIVFGIILQIMNTYFIEVIKELSLRVRDILPKICD
jgi:hypothetical protein